MTIRRKKRALQSGPEGRAARRRPSVVARALASMCAVAALAVLLAAYQNRAANSAMWASDLRAWPAPKSSDRILIFAPHCDDETLGLSGAIQQALRAGADVRVVFMTNGDGFQYSAERQLRRFRVRPEGFVEFGLERQQEALQALAVSGVPPENVVFLGYPDRGLASLWLYNWSPDQPYRSRFTGHRNSPYPNSLTPNAVYCGQSVLEDVTRLIREYRPTHVYCTHPNEDHPDHWATYAFVTGALHDLRTEKTRRRDHDILAALRLRETKGPVQGLYLIHRGDWPVPRGYRPDEGLPPPSGLMGADTAWRQIPISTDERQVKREAIRRYVSQTRVMNRFLTSFVRRNELLGTRGAGPLRTVDDGAIVVDGRTDDWAGIPTSIHDPVGDSLPSDFGASGDLVSLRAARDSRCLYVRIETRKPISRRVTYNVFWHALPNPGTGTRGVTLGIGRPLPAGVRAAHHGNVWEVALPRPPGDALFLTVHCRYGRLTIDKSGLRVLESSDKN